MYPLNDEQFEETSIAKAEKSGDGWSIQRADGWSFFVPATSPVEPKVGMPARFMGAGSARLFAVFSWQAKRFFTAQKSRKKSTTRFSCTVPTLPTG